MKIPIESPGNENSRLYSAIMPTSIRFLKPRARNMPYSYVFESTSANISEYRSMADSKARKMRIGTIDPSKNALIVPTALN